MANSPKTVREQIQENPVIGYLMGFILLGSITTGTLTSFGTFDQLVVTHAEYEEFVEPLKDQVGSLDEAITSQKQLITCDRIERKIDSREDKIWELKEHNDMDDPIVADRVRELESDVRRLRDKYNALNCAAILE